MTRDEEAPDPILFDRRIVERNIKRGLITRKDYEKFLKSRPDVSDNIRAADEATQAGSSPEGRGTPSPAPHGTPE